MDIYVPIALMERRIVDGEKIAGLTESSMGSRELRSSSQKSEGNKEMIVRCVLISGNFTIAEEPASSPAH